MPYADLGADAPYYELALSRDSSELSFANPYALGKKGIEVVDFDRQLRDSQPDIGADEIGQPALFSDGFESGGLEGWLR